MYFISELRTKHNNGAVDNGESIQYSLLEFYLFVDFQCSRVQQVSLGGEGKVGVEPMTQAQGTG